MKIKIRQLLILFWVMTSLISMNQCIASEDETVNQGKCTYPSSLSHGFKIADFKRCKEKMKQCPLSGPIPAEACIKNLMTQEAACKQTNEIAQQLEVSPFFITALKQQGFILLDAYFPADGAHQYSLLAPKGCLIDMLVDPRDLNFTIKKEYASNDFFLEAKDKPRLIQKADGTKRFTIDIQVKNICRACALIGVATVAFDFSQKGQWQATKLLEFKLSHH